MKNQPHGQCIFSRAFNAMPVAAVVFFAKRDAKPMANDAARQLFGMQLGALVKNRFMRETNGVLKAYPGKVLPWRAALVEGIGVQKEDMVLQHKETGEPVRFHVFAMPLIENGTVTASVAVFTERQKT